MTSVSVLPPSGEAFLDPRDDGRSMRVTWHPADQLFVLSMWRDGTCVASFRLDRAAAPQLVESLVANLSPVPSTTWSEPHYANLPPRHRSILPRKKR